MFSWAHVAIREGPEMQNSQIKIRKERGEMDSCWEENVAIFKQRYIHTFAMELCKGL